MTDPIKALAWRIKGEAFPALKINQVYEAMARGLGFANMRAFNRTAESGFTGAAIESLLACLRNPSGVAQRFAEFTGIPMDDSLRMVADILIPGILVSLGRDHE